jgi:tetratricopeptide (TPR) repeat protein
MEKIKLIIIFFSCLSLAQTETYTNIDLVSIENKGDSLYNAKKFNEASEYFKKLVRIDSENFNYNFKYASSYG